MYSYSMYIVTGYVWLAKFEHWYLTGWLAENSVNLYNSISKTRQTDELVVSMHWNCFIVR